MKKWFCRVGVVGAAMIVAACGGGTGVSTTTGPGITGLVSFGDSLSDAGTHAVGTVALLAGGRYTINSGDAANPSKIWLDLIAAQYGLAKPCPATTGINSRLPTFGAPVAVVNNTSCRNYAQGGARVTELIGPAHTLLPDSAGGAVGQLDYPLKNQIENHLTVTGGTFSGKELVTVMAGGNDAFMNGAAVSASAAGGAGAAGAATIAGWSAAEINAVLPGGAAAQQAAATSAVMAMGKAGAELAGYVKASIVGKGAKYVLVMNLPDLASSIYALENPTAAPLMAAMVTAFNGQLAAGLAGTAGVVVGDAYTTSRDQFANPASYGLSNVTQRACSTELAKNPLGGASLVCNPANLITGDVSRYLTADDIHPTPYGHKLLAQYASKVLASAGWLY
ncbi:MAG: hypothetical protein RIS90_2764 [Pseudomonadota bacterium]